MLAYNRTLIALVITIYSTLSFAAFTSNFSCNDTGKYCSQAGGYRFIDGIRVYQSCWEYSYTKTCNYPSKDDCKNYNCYYIKDLDCILKDSMGNCVNQREELSCKRKVYEDEFSNELRFNSNDKNAPKKLICDAIPCIDGSCIDSKYPPNDEMMKTIAQLQMAINMKGKNFDPNNIGIFGGVARHCSKHIAEYKNCCKRKGWGSEHLGAECPSEAIQLAKDRNSGLCVYAGKSSSKFVKKQHFCCFKQKLEKIIQEQGRTQINKGFWVGSGKDGKADCSPLTLSELSRIDFDKIDYSEFYNEIAERLNLPTIEGALNQLQTSMPDVFKHNPADPESKQRNSGVNINKMKRVGNEDYKK
ncbi:MAG: hypothetical protein K0R02_710 [Rickettsiaceae bacterium]|jgi:conjugal transfer mating pair stabilization protein TraN|nr:hypothetical protein [Rickettsiaceae bacterium]